MFFYSGSAQELSTRNIPGTAVAFQMVKVPTGSLTLTDGTAYEVDSFWMGVHEVTFDEYIIFQNKSFDSNVGKGELDYDADAITRPSPPYLDFTNGMGKVGGFPAVSMTQQAALRYCHWLYQKTGVFYRLPTELEWEYACLAGNTSSYFWGEDVDELEDYAWYYDNSFEKYHKVKEKESNPWGLYDMLGNVSEWMLDQYVSGYVEGVRKSETDWILPTGKYGRTVRGGAYDDDASDCSCRSRVRSNPAWQARDPQIPKSIWWNPDSPFVGFRLVQPSGHLSKEEVAAFFEKAIRDE